ncbi:hypothetical protein CFBP3846_03674 [Pseudomonas syringae pv. avii]|uniref:TetR family transcriptional regulator n=1 Tax=Pseudomonas syringae pv. avii TaxID=663959 RepID=A0ABY1U9Y5_PSESX|nr:MULTISPECIES: hypothetical protein [Pseudomonas syringae group]KWT10601.1 hypothetical protein AL046_00890 [Pseudomonas syringae pv. avii]PHN54803.1 hypothetical protein AO286_19165 [Pseudomonas syringae]RMR16404.1 hypothetical protein ALP89_03406 [Pseudomonas syringae pv. persicae]SOS28081.1 hypothetical protein CFBP3846_03674 [Pseudomonas syringae pv. avii]
MLNEQAAAFFSDRIKKVASLAPTDLVAAEAELGVASGLLSYALFSGDISFTEHSLLNRHITRARNERVARLCASTLRVCA